MVEEQARVLESVAGDQVVLHAVARIGRTVKTEDDKHPNRKKGHQQYSNTFFKRNLHNLRKIEYLDDGFEIVRFKIERRQSIACANRNLPRELVKK